MFLTTTGWKNHVIIIAILHVRTGDVLEVVNNEDGRQSNREPIQGFNIESRMDVNSEDDSENYGQDENMESQQPDHLTERPQNNDHNEETVRNIVEEKFKFRNDETTTRFKIANANFRAHPESQEDRDIAIAFRSYAARRIVGGMETSISMYPYNVGIARDNKHWCGGSIIDEQWVLTAGHCLEAAYDGEKHQLAQFIVRAGSSFHNRGGYQARVNKVFFPKNYTPGSADYDFSLIRLDRPMPIGRNIAVLNLPSNDYVMKEKDMLIVTGWGSTDPSGHGHIPERVRFVPVPVIRLNVCQKSYRFYITQRMLCAGYNTGGKDACNHDSGGPAVRDGVLLGVVSFGGKQCGDPNSPGVYSRVSEITDWIESTISNNEAYNVPELKEKIDKARARERELQKFKARVEDKQNKIKTWLRQTLKSPRFISLAKKKLKNAGFLKKKKKNSPSRRSEVNEYVNASVVDEKVMDEINLANQIEDRILMDGEDHNTTESDKLLRALAFQDIIMTPGSYELNSELRDKEDASIEALIAYISL